MYDLYVDGKLSMISNDLVTLKKMAFALAAKGHVVAYLKVKDL